MHHVLKSYVIAKVLLAECRKVNDALSTEASQANVQSARRMLRAREEDLVILAVATQKEAHPEHAADLDRLVESMRNKVVGWQMLVARSASWLAYEVPAQGAVEEAVTA